MTRDLVIVGCGGFGRETADIVDAINRQHPTWNLLGFIDDAPDSDNVARVEQRGSTVIGGSDGASLTSQPHFVVGIGDSDVRTRMATIAEGHGWLATTLVHPTAALGANLTIGLGSIVGAHVAVGSDVSIGRHVHLDRGVHVGHDSTLADFVTAHPAAVISGSCRIAEGAEVGTNCTLLPGTSVGARAIVGAAACVTKDVAPGLTVRGVPAR